jgi:peptide/nickel transport system permease protein
MLGQTSDPTAERALREFFGLNLPAWRQYLAWLGNVVSGNLGMSWTRGQPVGPLIGGALLVTLQLGLMTLVIATAVGVPLGLVAGIYEGQLLDKAIQSFSLVGLAAPVFWVGLMLLVGVSSLAGWSPPLLYAPPTASLADNLAILALPIASLGLLQAAAYAQFVRQSVVSAFHQDYVRTAIAKGLPTRVVFFKHILRNILIPLITFMGLILIQILGGVVVIESLFALPGLGRLLLTSIQNRDFPLVQGGLLLVVIVAMLINLMVDLLYQYVDPRMRQ